MNHMYLQWVVLLADSMFRRCKEVELLDTEYIIAHSCGTVDDNFDRRRAEVLELCFESSTLAMAIFGSTLASSMESLILMGGCLEELAPARFFSLSPAQLSGP
jgi:hypothetical protein